MSIQPTQPLIAVANAAAPVETAPVRKPNPSKVRLAAIMLVAVYPLITALLTIILPLTDGWEIWQRTLLLAPLMVGSIVFVIAPLVQKHLGWFIARMPRPTR